jgi:hypothetical protein
MTDLSKLVKPLEWVDMTGRTVALSASIVGNYEIKQDGAWIAIWFNGSRLGGALPTIEAAKAAAQADYTARILATLDLEALARWRDEAVQAEREACAEAVESLWAYRTCSEVAAAIRARKGGEA